MSSGDRRRRKSYDVAFKLRAIDERRAGRTVSQVAVSHGVTPKMVRDWLRHEADLRAAAMSARGAGGKRKLHPGRAPADAQLDSRLYDALLVRKRDGRRVRNKDLQEMALEIAADLGLRQFRASSMFLRRWKKRFHVDVRKETCTSSGELVGDALSSPSLAEPSHVFLSPETEEDLEERLYRFRVEVVELRQANDDYYASDGIVTLTETHFCEQSLRSPFSSDAKTNDRPVSNGLTRPEFTVVLGASSNGYKLPATIVVKMASGKEADNLLGNLKLPENIRLLANDSGRVADNELRWVVTNVYLPANKPNDPLRMLIVPDAWEPLPADTQDYLDEYCRTDTVAAPVECLPLRQPVSSSVEARFRQDVERRFEVAIDGFPQSDQPSRSLQSMVSSVASAWEGMDGRAIADAFLACGISSALDGSQEDKLLPFIPSILPEEEDVSEIESDTSRSDGDSTPSVESGEHNRTP